MLSLRAAIAGICALAALATADARADDPYYKGKRLTLLIGSAAGGPTDIEGRLFAKYLGRHIDGQPSVIVQNKEGAGGVLAPTYLGEVGPKDGTMLGYFSGTAWNYVNNPEHWRVDLKTFEFVAYQSGTTIHFVRTDVPPGMKKPTDIVKAVGLVAGGTSVDNPKDIRLRLGLDMLGVPYTICDRLSHQHAGTARAAARRDSNVFGIATELSRRHRAEPGEDRRGDPGLVRYRRRVR